MSCSADTPTDLSAASRRRATAALALALVALSGCSTFTTVDYARMRANPVPGIQTPAAVFVADGAGNFQVASQTLRAVARADGYPLEVICFDWSHGYLRMLADQVDYPHARSEGRKLAELIAGYRAVHPDTPVYLMGHSAGAMVILTALEELPPCTIDGAVLLSPSVSALYDVRPALQAIKDGLHVFYSHDDYLYLGVVTRLLGTSDRRWTSSSGRVGFLVAPVCYGGEMAKLSQRAWRPEDAALGNNGGHFGNYQPDFLRHHVVPLLQPAATPSSLHFHGAGLIRRVSCEMR